LLRGTLDNHSKEIQSQPTRKRKYDDTRFYCEDSPPEGLPDWAVSDEEEPKEKGKGKKTMDWDFSDEEEPKGKGKGKKTKGKGKEKEKEKKVQAKRRRIADTEATILYSTDEEHRTGESAKIGELRGALKKSK
jgi:hypothetical protein